MSTWFEVAPLQFRRTVSIPLTLRPSALSVICAGGVGVGVGVGEPACAQYRPPVFKKLPSNPPQTIISVPIHTAVWSSRASGALGVLVALQLSVLGLYLPPVLKSKSLSTPPQTIISLPVHTAV